MRAPAEPNKHRREKFGDARILLIRKLNVCCSFVFMTCQVLNSTASGVYMRLGILFVFSPSAMMSFVLFECHVFGIYLSHYFFVSLFFFFRSNWNMLLGSVWFSPNSLSRCLIIYKKKNYLVIYTIIFFVIKLFYINIFT